MNPVRDHKPAAARQCLLWALLLTIGQAGFVASASAQALTLPTVRTFGPGPEEQVLQRVVSEMQKLYASDTTPGATAAAKLIAERVLRRLNVMILAPVTDEMFERYLVAKSDQEELLALAGADNLGDDPSPRLRLAAIRSISHDPMACSLLSVKQATSVGQRLDRARGLVNEPGRFTFMVAGATVPQDTVLRRLSCAYDELRERTPAQAFSSIVVEEKAAGHADRAAKLDTIARAATALVILRKLSTRLWAPVTSGPQAETFWRQRGWAPLNIGSISGTSKSGVVFTELASPLLQSVRVSVNAVLVAEDASKKATTAGSSTTTEVATDPDANIKRLLTGGGLFNVSFAWPVLYQGWNDNSVDLMILATPRFGVTAPVLAAAGVDSSTINADFGLEFHAKALDIGHGVGVVAQFRVAEAVGSSNFVKGLGVSRSSVAYATSTFGFVFGGQYLLTASKAIAGPTVIRKSPWQIGLTVVKLGS